MRLHENGFLLVYGGWASDFMNCSKQSQFVCNITQKFQHNY